VGRVREGTRIGAEGQEGQHGENPKRAKLGYVARFWGGGFEERLVDLLLKLWRKV